MRIFFVLLSFLFFSNCSYTNYATNEIETSSVVTVKPKIVKESAFENFCMSEKLEKELNKIQFTSTSYLRSNKDCIGIIRLSVSGSIDYYQLINTLKKRAHDIGGNAIGVYDYREKKESEIKELKQNHQDFKNEIENNQKNYEKIIDEAAEEISSFVEKANLKELS